MAPGLSKLVARRNCSTVPSVRIRPTLLGRIDENHSAPSGPAVMVVGYPCGTAYSLTFPAVVIRPIFLPSGSVNHSAWSGPCAMPNRPLFFWLTRTGNSVTWPEVVIRPIRLPRRSVNQSAPSGPATMSAGRASGPAAYSVMCPPAVIRSIALKFGTVNHSAPSGPSAMLPGRGSTCSAGGPPRWPPLAAGAGRVGMGNSVICPAGLVAIRPIRSPLSSVNHSAPSGPDTMSPGQRDSSASFSRGSANWLILLVVSARSPAEDVLGAQLVHATIDPARRRTLATRSMFMASLWGHGARPDEATRTPWRYLCG